MVCVIASATDKTAGLSCRPIEEVLRVCVNAGLISWASLDTLCSMHDGASHFVRRRAATVYAHRIAQAWHMNAKQRVGVPNH